MSYSCQKCSADNSDSAQFCRNCGAALDRTVAVAAPLPDPATVCPQCSAPYESGAKFCKVCGTPIAAAAAPAAMPEPVSVPAAPASAVASQSVKNTTAVAHQNAKPYLIWGAVALGVLILAGAAYWLLKPGASNVEGAAPAVATAPVPEPAASAPEPEPVPAPAAEPPLAPVPAITPAPAPAKAPQKTPPKSPVPKPVQQVITTQRSEPPPPPTRTAPLPAPTAVTKPTLTPPVPSGPSSPEEACGKRVFVALAMCVQEQCQTPQFVNHAQCVEMRRLQKANQDRINNM